jgi:hypothetical protein
MCQIALYIQFVFQNVSDHSWCSVCVSECVRSLDLQFMFQNVSDRSMFSLCFRMCQIALDLQFVFQNVSDCSLFSLCLRMCRITLDVQFVFQNVSDHSRCSVCVLKCVRSLLMFSLCWEWSDTFRNTNWTSRVIWHILKHKLNIKSNLTHSETQTEHREQSDTFWNKH